MNKEEQELYRKYALKSMKYHMQCEPGQGKAYILGWEHAIQYVNEVMEVRSLQMMSDMSDDEFNAFLRNQLGGDK